MEDLKKWLIPVAVTITATALIQVVRWWADADAYDSEVAAAIAPLAEVAKTAKEDADFLKVELQKARIQGQQLSVEQKLYELERAREESPREWNARDAEREAELKRAATKLEEDLLAVGAAP